MKDLCVCFIGSNETAKLLANKSSLTDIEFSHYAKDKDVLTIIRPVGFPEKIKSLIQAINLSEYVVIELDVIDKYFGEVMILLDLLGKKGEFIVQLNKQYVQAQVQALIKGTKIENYKFRLINNNEDIKALKEELLAITPAYGTEPLIVIDDFFNVKGVGTVALGFTKGGTIKAKDTLTLQPGNKKIQINSIQVMDVDYREMSTPARVGLALKNCDITDLERGSIISKGLPETKEITGTLIKSKYCKKDITGQLMIINGLLSIQADVKENKATLPKAIPLITDSIIFDPTSNPRILGIIKK